MTKARTQLFCKAKNNNLGYYDGIRVFPRSITEKNIALFLYNNHCLIWKTEKVSFNQAPKELKDNFKIVDNYITEENVDSQINYEFIPQKNESHLTNFIVYDLGNHNTDRAKPYIMNFNRLSKIAGRYERDPTQKDLRKSINDNLSFVGDNCIGNALDFLLKFKGDERKVKKKIVE